MYQFDLDSFITLFLINKVKEFRDSYSLTRALAWKFDIITILDITRKLEDEKLITKTLEHVIEKYEITKEGMKYIDANMAEGKALMLEKYKKEQSFINSLFGNG